MNVDAPQIRATEIVDVDALRPHPRNYRSHPQDQLDHLVQSIREHGFYRNVVIARDGTILAGHGVVQASKQIGLKKIPVIKVDLSPDDPKALKIVTGDNEVSRLAEIDDRMLSELLKEIKDTDTEGLFGTGYDEKMLANLVFVTRPQSEIKDINEAAEWVGMPEYVPKPDVLKLIVQFESKEDREKFMAMAGLTVVHKSHGEGAVWSTIWPDRPRDDLTAMRYQSDE
jgi:hypothetical protein